MRNIDGAVRAACLRGPGRTAFRHKQDGSWRDTTYGALWSESDRVAAGLVRAGFRAGEHAAILAPSSPRWVIAYLGILKAGGVVVPVDRELKSAELGHVLGDSAAGQSVVSPDIYRRFAQPFEKRYKQQLGDGLPEARAVVHLLQVRELVRDDVVDHRQREVHQPPVQADVAVVRARAPLRARRRQRPRTRLRRLACRQQLQPAEEDGHADGFRVCKSPEKTPTLAGWAKRPVLQRRRGRGTTFLQGRKEVVFRIDCQAGPGRPKIPFRVG